VPVSRSAFDAAADLAMNSKSGLRSGDSLHLAVAGNIGANTILTADRVLAKNAKAISIVAVEF
jgi:predicted nucleic acid-binding protein